MAARFHLLAQHRTVADLRKAAAADLAVRKEIEAEIAALAGIHPDRCVMTKEYVAALKEALG